MHLVIMLYALFASVFTISKTGLYYTQPFFFVGSRMCLAGLFMLGYFWIRHRDQIQFDGQFFRRILRLSIFNIYFTNTLEFYGLKHLTSFKTCFIYSLSPFFAALFSYFIFTEKLTSKKWVGLLIGCIGMVPILMNESGGEERMGHIFFLSWAELAVMGAAACSVYGWILLKQLVFENKRPIILVNGLSMIIGGIFALGHSYFVEDWNPIPVTEMLPFMECMLLLILVSNLICYNLYGHLLKSYSATFMSFAGFTTPLFTALFGWFFLGEVVTLSFYISTAILFAGLVLFHQEELKLGLTTEPVAGT